MTRIRFDGSRDHPPLSRLARPPEEAATLGPIGRARKPLRRPYVPGPKAVSKLDAHQCDLAVLGAPSCGRRPEDRMLDLLYLAIGIGVFALFAGYAAALRRL